LPGRNRAALHLRSAFFVTIAGLCFFQAWKSAHEWGEYAPRHALHGLYEVVEFSVNGEARPPLTSDRGRWKRLVIERPQFVTVVLMDDTVSRYGWTVDLEKKTLTLKRDEGTPAHAVLHYEQAGNELVLEGKLLDAPIRARLRKRDPGSFLLLNRGFHWVNEYPFNR
jgi:hypothetical protein